MSSTREPVEAKVKAGTAAAYLGSVGLLAVLSAVQDHPGFVAGLPDWLEPIALGIVPGVVAFVSGWKARHTPRGARE